jgi:8-oxo-dGTP pyrophosphatase MutT (NUDIX family)
LGAGLIPFSVMSDQVFFLFQKTFSGRKQGYLIDFGGGINPDEDAKTAAAREFVEETETLFFADDIDSTCRTPSRISEQTRLVLNMLDQTLDSHPDWWSKRRKKPEKQSKDWWTYFVEVAYRDIQPLNVAWENDTSRRFKKRRELHWIPGNQLLQFYRQEPERLWKRVRELETGPEIVEAIIHANQP